MKKVGIVILILGALIVLGIIRKGSQTDAPISVGADEQAPVDPGDYLLSISFAGLDREYLLHIPPGYDGKNPTPLVLNLHGGGGDISSAQLETQMSVKSDQAGFLVVYPKSFLSLDGGKRWNNGPRTIEKQKQGTQDDIGFFRALIAQLEAQYNIDSKRIYATGISNGAFMTYRVACEMSDIIAAIAPVSGYSLLPNCNPERPIAVLHIHGTGDGLTPYEGGPSYDSVPDWARNLDDFGSARESFAVFTQRANCPTNAQVTYQKGSASCEMYGPCDGQTDMTFCTIEGGGHTWPGGKYPINLQWYKNVVGSLSTDLNANDLIWEFFQAHPLP